MLHNKCRICLDHFRRSTALVDLFSELNAHLLRQIYSITGLQIINISGLPKHICRTCLVDLGCAIEFRQRCFITQKQFIEIQNTDEVYRGTAQIKCKNNDEDSCDLIEYEGEFYDSPEIENLTQKAEDDIDSQIEYFFTTTDEYINKNVSNLPELKAVNNEVQNTNEDTSSAEKLNSQGTFPQTKGTGQKVGPFVCDECGKSINYISNYREHKLRHSGFKNFLCRYCRKRFTTHKELNRHVRRHTGERPHKCKFCPSTFSDLGTVRQHERRHINSRPFKCNECTKTFFSSSCLSKHRLIHKSLPRTHHCNICDMWFHRVDHLTAHTNCRKHKVKAQNIKLASLLN